MILVDKIFYKFISDENWGEYELDYILFLKKDVETIPNFNEVSEVEYMDEERVRRFIDEKESHHVFSFSLINRKG